MIALRRLRAIAFTNREDRYSPEGRIAWHAINRADNRAEGAQPVLREDIRHWIHLLNGPDLTSLREHPGLVFPAVVYAGLDSARGHEPHRFDLEAIMQFTVGHKPEHRVCKPFEKVAAGHPQSRVHDSCLGPSPGLQGSTGPSATLPAQTDPHGFPVDACHATDRASRVAAFFPFHACQRPYSGGNGPVHMSLTSRSAIGFPPCSAGSASALEVSRPA